MPWVWVWLLVLTGCSHDWDLLDPRLDAPGAGSGGAGAGGASPGCGTIAVLAEDFEEDGVVPSLWTLSNNASVNAGTVGGDGDGGWTFTTKRLYDLRNNEVFVELAAPDQAEGGSAEFRLIGEGVNAALRFALTAATAGGGGGAGGAGEPVDAMLNFEMKLGSSVWTAVGSVPFDPAEHRWWRFREDGTNTYWETAKTSDGEWTEQKSHPSAALFPLDFLEVELAGDGTARFDNVNGGEEPSEQRCKSSTFADDFDDGFRGRTWRSADGAVEYAGVLNLSLPAENAAAHAEYISARGYDLRDDAIVIQLTNPPAAETVAELQLIAYYDASNQLSVTLGPDPNNVGEQDLTVAKCVSECSGNAPDTQSKTIQFALDQHRWWRIREEADTIYFEAGSDGLNWTEIFAPETDKFRIDALEVRIQAQTAKDEDNNGLELDELALLSLDNFNLPPAP